MKPQNAVLGALILTGALTLVPSTAVAQCVFCASYTGECKSVGLGSGSLTCYYSGGHCFEAGQCQQDPEGGPGGFAARQKAVPMYASIAGTPLDRSLVWDVRSCEGKVIGRLYSPTALSGRLGEYRRIEIPHLTETPPLAGSHVQAPSYRIDEAR